MAEEIVRRDAAAERLIGWVQLGVVLFFALLYSIAPRAEGASGFNFVPWALGVYFLFTVWRLGLSYRRELPGWALNVSIVADMLLLVGIIFSFHIQYNQHPTFYLKAPTVMYMFLFIALRALRLDPRFVLTAGFVAALGWVGLVGYAVMADPEHMLVTRNYVRYLTSNSILIGAELDKLIIILAVTLLLAFGLSRARGIFFEAIRNHLAASDLKRFFAPEVARTIINGNTEVEVGQGMVVEAAVLMVDVRGFSQAAAQLPPEAVMRILGCYQACAVPVIQRRGGRIDKFLGDGILATFGAIAPSQSYAADALAAAIEVVAVVNAAQSDFAEAGWPGKLRIGVAVASGSLTIGIVGVADRLEYTVIGRPVNLAAKLEDANKVFDTCAIAAADTYELALNQGVRIKAMEVRRNVTIAGLDKPIDVALLVRGEGAPIMVEPSGSSSTALTMSRDGMA
ncbi:adenylate/guanylate cyclase domain-containing protein [Breoghania corrubedonensis]|nr:adenylate/guanylate cyclase domain-containing protein [Breoghania corrubedonensis]